MQALEKDQRHHKMSRQTIDECLDEETMNTVEKLTDFPTGSLDDNQNERNQDWKRGV